MNNVLVTAPITADPALIYTDEEEVKQAAAIVLHDAEEKTKTNSKEEHKLITVDKVLVSTPITADPTLIKTDEEEVK